MLSIIVAAAIGLANVMVFETEDMSVSLYNEACTMEMVPEQLLPQFKKAIVVFEGKPLKACYTIQGKDVVVIDEEGDGGIIPVKNFKEMYGV